MLAPQTFHDSPQKTAILDLIEETELTGIYNFIDPELFDTAAIDTETAAFNAFDIVLAQKANNRISEFIRHLADE